MTLTPLRSRIVQWADWMIAHTAEIHYAEIRPMPHTDALPLTTDCSGLVTLVYQLAGAPDPNGQGFDGEGYTGTLLDHGTHIPLADVLPGDLIVYGPGTGWHTALVVEAGPDPLTVSHGGPGGPSLVRVSQDGREPQTYLRFVPDAAPTPAPAPKPAPPKPAPTGDNVTLHPVKIHIASNGQGDTATSIPAAKVVAITAQFGLGPRPAGVVGFVSQGGNALVTAKGWGPGITLDVIVAEAA